MTEDSKTVVIPQRWPFAERLQRLQSLLQVSIPSRLFWLSAALLTLLLLCAESTIASNGSGLSSSSGDLSAQVDGQVAQMQGNSLRQFCYAAIFCVGVACFVRTQKYRITWRLPLAPICGALLLWCALSTTWAEEPLTSLKRLTAYFFMVTGAAGITLIWSRTQMTQFISLFSAASLTLGVLIEVMFGTLKPWIPDYRFSGTQHENVEGFCCLVQVLASLAAADADSRYRKFYWGLAAYGAVFLVLTKSRSSFLGLAVALLTYFLLTRSFMAKVWAVVGLASTFMVLYTTDVLSPVLAYLSRDAEGLDTLTGRTPLWELADEFVSKRPMSGYGYQAFWTGPHIEYFSSAFGWQISSAHNSYLETLLGLGYIGVVLHTSVMGFAVLMGAIYYRRTSLPVYALASSMFAALLVVGMLESTVVISPGPYHFGLTLLMASLCFKPRFTTELSQTPTQEEQGFGFGEGELSQALLEV